MSARRDLTKVVPGALPVELAALGDADRATLAALVDAAAAARAASLDKAVADSLRVIPRPLRGTVRRSLGL